MTGDVPTRAQPTPRPGDVARFVERLGSALTDAGMPRLPARVFAALLAREDGRMTAAELADGLQVSAGSVSGAVRYLAQVRLIHRERERGSRRDVYVVMEDAWHDAAHRLQRLAGLGPAISGAAHRQPGRCGAGRWGLPIMRERTMRTASVPAQAATWKLYWHEQLRSVYWQERNHL